MLVLLAGCGWTPTPASPDPDPDTVPTASSTTASSKTAYAMPDTTPRRYLGRANVEMYSLPVDPPCLRMPLGDEEGAGARVSQIFQSERNHLGEDHVIADGPSRGAPVHAIAPGRVIDAWDYGSERVEQGCWGRVVRVVHRLDDDEGGWTFVESLYAHLDRIDVELGERVEAGAVLGTVGDAGCGGPHLHWELRDSMNMPLGFGYGRDTKGYLAPSAFVRAHRCE